MAELTYPDVGATRDGPLPAGYRHIQKRICVGTGESIFTAGKVGLRDFAMQRGAGLRVRPPGVRADLGVEMASGLGFGPVRLWAPCRVVWVVDEPTRYGYGYGTLDGHPESGEEAFELALDAERRVWFAVRAFSRPGHPLVRLGWPVAALLADLTTRRYLRAMRAISNRGQAPT
jgi:uncharacterized protein (UPF0548 family)